jgi:hypothetical protein
LNSELIIWSSYDWDESSAFVKEVAIENEPRVWLIDDNGIGDSPEGFGTCEMLMT